MTSRGPGYSEPAEHVYLWHTSHAAGEGLLLGEYAGSTTGVAASLSGAQADILCNVARHQELGGSALAADSCILKRVTGRGSSSFLLHKACSQLPCVSAITHFTTHFNHQHQHPKKKVDLIWVCLLFSPSFLAYTYDQPMRSGG